MTPKEIRTLRQELLHLTQPQFGQLFGVHPMTVSKWERGQLEPNPYQTTLMEEFKKAARDKSVRDTLTGVLLGAGIAAALLLLLQAAKK